MSEHESDVQSQSVPTPASNDVSDDDIRALVEALNDPNDEQYAYVEEKLVALGSRAVPFLINVLNEQEPWLRSFRATEALGQIGDGRASRPLIGMLRHPNSNVRWGAVRALAKVGDSRAILPLRRIASSDRSKTSWGESVASSAQAALNEMNSRSAMLRMSEPIKIAILVALALFSIWFATDRVQAFRQVMDNSESQLWGTAVVPIIPTEVAQEDDEASAEDAEAALLEEGTPTPTVDVDATPIATPEPVIVNVVSANANIRPNPNTSGSPIASVPQGTELEVVGEQSGWYQVVLPDNTGRGWISASIVSPPSGPIPTPTPGN